ncbi:MAG: magnesium chelatase [Bacteroidota bacterium]|nr:magnesium chelatase [Bacteroidota bacterium]
MPEINKLLQIHTLGDLKKSGFKTKSIKQELRDNLIVKLKTNEKLFEGIWGYEDTVVPDVERAILSMHNFILLGLRGQAKTRIARLMVELLDEYIPYVADSELYDDPFNPLSKFAKNQLEIHQDNTPISWLHRSERYTEKLATPDVSVADLIGDVDPIKAASLKLSYSDERVIHFGLIPRSNRQIFVINELPDLQPRIQVSLFNILQEGDIQIRGFKLRLPLDIQFVFTANPEDYTNRGSIVTPLKDRIESQILTHYPKNIETGKAITKQEAYIKVEQKEKVKYPEIALEIIEQIAIEARSSEFVDAKSGVSARLTISALENLLSSAERRMLINSEKNAYVRVSDFWGVLPAITGKIELVYEGEQEGSAIVAQNLVSKSIRTLFLEHFPNPEKSKKKSKIASQSLDKPKEVPNPYEPITLWFSKGNTLDILNDCSTADYEKLLMSITGLQSLVQSLHPKISKEEQLFMMEFALHGLAEYSLLSKNRLERGIQFKDLFNSMFDTSKFVGEDEDLDFRIN